MTQVTRRRLMGQAAVVAGGAALVHSAAQAAPGAGAGTRAAAQDDKTEIMIYHIWGTPPGGTPAEKPHPMTQVIDAFNAQSTTTTVTSLTPGNYQETLQKTQADIAAGNPPDLVSVPWANLHYAIDGLEYHAAGGHCRRTVRRHRRLDVGIGLATRDSRRHCLWLPVGPLHADLLLQRRCL